MYELTVEDYFSAAHQLYKSKTPCENLHGHNWKVEVTIVSEQLDKEVGWVMDFKKIKTALKTELMRFDHKVLNDVMEVSPTAEHIAREIYQGLKKTLPVKKVTVWETERAAASYYE
jgi:6-pyruvoyltetrahydropterin/6-carboxytetrahydropterin synthase